MLRIEEGIHGLPQPAAVYDGIVVKPETCDVTSKQKFPSNELPPCQVDPQLFMVSRLCAEDVWISNNPTMSLGKRNPPPHTTHHVDHCRGCHRNWQKHHRRTMKPCSRILWRSWNSAQAEGELPWGKSSSQSSSQSSLRTN